MTASWDVVIVGAGPAGCAAAYDLAAAGQRVLLLDRRTFPRHKACACGLTRKTLKALRYSVEPVLERQCREVVLQEAGPAFLQGERRADKKREVRIHLRQPFCAMAVRERFDAFCLEQTLARGAGFCRIEGVVSVRETRENVEVEVVLPGGERATLVAPVLLGADGSNGQMRRVVNGLAAARQRVGAAADAGLEVRTEHLPTEPAWYARGFALEATVPYAVLPATLPAGDQPEDLVFDFAPIAGGYGWLFPKGDHINVGVGGFVPQGTEGPSAGVGDMAYESVTRGLLAEYVRLKLGVELASDAGVHVSGQHLGLGGHAYQPEGRVLLAGDAAGLVDPLTGEGIHSALVSGQAAAAAILSVRATGDGVAEAYARELAPLRETLVFSHRAARSFYREPERGFKVMRTPLLRGLVLKTYADGLPTGPLLAKLARRVA